MRVRKMYFERSRNSFEESQAYYRLARKCSVYRPTLANAGNIATPFPLSQYLNLSLQGSNLSRAKYVRMSTFEQTLHKEKPSDLHVIKTQTRFCIPWLCVKIFEKDYESGL
jgi:hypothetical protein